ncbi:pentatricopeptide repeat-containing protein At1g77170, mitochondrial-like [Eucalyptus grandis]|uniref:pentatricopeptide repeat-containing protein At1g77170, mitochondrial-like n=1 Tax=Eucalyptus grandis TaxID=71139 RepID=UPI00192EA30E|nr:pentatricopeptide repeat-containing protein At1g77170, mitochondrial-like [Eucalyptus grandis]
MISFRHLQRGLSKFSSRRRLWTSCAFDHGGTHKANASSVVSLLAQSRQQPDSPSSTQAHAKMVATLLSECGDKRGLSLIHAHVIRSRLLDSNPVAFHWNIIRVYARLDAPRKALLVYAFMARRAFVGFLHSSDCLEGGVPIFDFEAGRLHVPAAEELCLLFSGLHPD